MSYNINFNILQNCFQENLIFIGKSFQGQENPAPDVVSIYFAPASPFTFTFNVLLSL